MRNRFKSPLLWAALISLILLIIKSYITKEMPPEDVVLNMVLAVLTALGIINNPTSKKNL